MSGSSVFICYSHKDEAWRQRLQKQLVELGALTFLIHEIITEVTDDFWPSAHVERLMTMGLLVVKECTDHRFLPSHYSAWYASKR